MGFLNRLLSGASTWLRPAAQSADGGRVLTTSEEIAAALRMGSRTHSGAHVTADSAMTVAAVYACVRIISGSVANLPLQVKRRVDDKTREDASDHELWALLSRKPNRWQTPAQFKRFMQVSLLLRGNAYALIVRSRGRVVALVPLHADRMEARQNDALELEYEYTRGNGRVEKLRQSEVMHMVGMSLDGVTGVSVIKYARETIGLSLAMEQHGATQFKNGLRPSAVLSHPGSLGKDGAEFLRASLDEFRSGGDREGRALILEEGMKADTLSMTPEDAQWIEGRKFSRSDIAMFFGVPPHMIGDTEKSTSWGTGIEQQGTGYVTFTLEDHLTVWEQTVARDLIREDEPNIYARFNRSALTKGDIKTRWETHTRAMQWGALSPNEVRAMEDMNPRDGGDVYYDPPNMAGGSGDSGDGDEPEKPA